tara:strand:+ start:12289 stop:13305 length:1017 start_codon:yes stop_codon:yes gene_type:complete
MISIRRCEKDDIASVIQFIELEWNPNHILVKNRNLLEWQHGNTDGYNFILAWDGNVLVGVLGYIPTRRYDDELSMNNILWMALWKVREEVQSSMVGLKLLKELENIENNAALAVHGINLKHLPLYKALGYQVYELEQYYIANPDVSHNILHNPERLPIATSNYGTASLEILSLSDLENLKLPIETASSYKTPKYFMRRFIQHPFYKYVVYGIVMGDKMSAIMSTRIVEHNGSSILRIVDFIGDKGVLGDCGSGLQKLMSESCLEYIDFWQYGISSKILKRAGFQKVKPTGKLICPNYFEPFVVKNSRQFCCIKGNNHSPFVFCRADGDQDRPNVLLYS